MRFNLLILLLLMGLTHTSQATQQTPNNNQKLFLQAEKAIKQKDWSQYQRLEAQLQHYSLLPYLRFDYLSKNLKLSQQKSIDQFIKNYADMPLSNQLRARFANQLSKNKQWDAFANYYKKTSNSRLECLYLTSQFVKKPNKAARKQLNARVAKVWSSAKSLPKQCDPLFKKWKKGGHLTHKLAYERLLKVAQSGPVNLLKYLERYLSKKQRYIAKLWVKVRNNPAVIKRHNFFPKKDPNLEAPLMVYAMNKLSWGNRDQAHRIWRKVQKRIPLASEHKNAIERTLFLAQATENKAPALDWVKKHSSKHLQDSLVNHWKLATLLRHNKWTKVLELYNKVPSSQKNSQQWKYWRATALYKIGKTTEAIPLLQTLATERDYYGYLAAAKLKQPLLLNHKPAQISKEVLNKIKLMAHTERAKELFQLKRYKLATREWRYLLKRLKTNQEFIAAAKVAHDWGWYDQGIITIAKAKAWDATDIRFPTAFKQDYLNAAQKVSLPAAWLMGVSRQESAYGPYAISPAGAYGLMQVLPSTAKIYARKLSIPYKNKKELLEPQANITMGSHYLALRYKELENNPIYASAAYNAGKHKIDQWKAFGHFATEIWIEAIPYTETRDYIKRVMTYRAIYAEKLGIKDDVFDYIISGFTGDKAP